MTEPSIWEIDLPDVTIEDIFRAEGADYGKSPPRPSTVELHRRILAEAASLVRPAVIWREVDVLGASERELFLEQGKKLTSRLLARVAGSADKLILFAMTLGRDIDGREKYYSKAGKILEAFALNASGTAYILKSGLAARDEINRHYQKAGLKTTFSLGPGHSYWSSLEDVRTIFHLLDAGQMGLRLTDSNIMLPSKSIAMVLAAGRNLPGFEGKTHCDFCSLQKKCHISGF